MATQVIEQEQPRPSPTPRAAPAAPGREVVVSVRGLTKIFKDFWGRPKARAVNGVDFDVCRGEVFGLLGPNGSGKSTTVKMILGLLRPTAGQILVFQHAPRHVATKARIGYLPEESYLYRFLDARETLRFFGDLFELPPRERDRRAEQLLEMVGLGGARARAVGEFSKGMQRRIGLAQALINDPDLVILDEPTAGLDPIGCREVKDLILALARRGKTVILSSHLLADVEDVCDRVVIYYGGKIQAMGALKDLLTERDTIRITTPVLSRPTLEKVLEILRSEVSAQQVQVDNPTQNLERYFLEVVRRAREQAEETSGATSANVMAEYLRPADNAAPDRRLERFTRPQAAEAPVTAPAPAPAAPAPDAARLEQLTQAPASAPEAPATPAQTAGPSADTRPVSEELRQADEKLRNLLKGS